MARAQEVEEMKKVQLKLSIALERFSQEPVRASRLSRLPLPDKGQEEFMVRYDGQPNSSDHLRIADHIHYLLTQEGREPTTDGSVQHCTQYVHKNTYVLSFPVTGGRPVTYLEEINFNGITADVSFNESPEFSAQQNAHEFMERFLREERDDEHPRSTIESRPVHSFTYFLAK